MGRGGVAGIASGTTGDDCGASPRIGRLSAGDDVDAVVGADEDMIQTENRPRSESFIVSNLRLAGSDGSVPFNRAIRRASVGFLAVSCGLTGPTVTYASDMSTSSSDDWRAAALRQLEEADTVPLEAPKTADIGPVLGKIALLIVLSLGLVFFLGFGTLFAVGLVGWYLFWVR